MFIFADSASEDLLNGAQDSRVDFVDADRYRPLGSALGSIDDCGVGLAGFVPILMPWRGVARGADFAEESESESRVVAIPRTTMTRPTETSATPTMRSTEDCDIAEAGRHR